MDVQQYPHEQLVLSAGWSVENLAGSRTGTVVKTAAPGETVTFLGTGTDFVLIAPPCEVYDARLQVTVDGANTKIINMKGAKNNNPAGVAQEKVTLYPLALGLPSGTHTIVLTTLDAVIYRIDSIETKAGTLPLDNTKLLASGDSITQLGGQKLNSNGYEDPVGGTDSGWVTLLANHLGRTKQDIGEGSSTIDQGIIHFWDSIKEGSSIPSKMTIMFGINDILQAGINDEAFIARRFGDYIDVIRSVAPGIEITLGQISYLGRTFSSYDTSAEAWNQALYQVALQKQTKFALTHVAYHSDIYVPDGVHPNPSGHQLIYQAFRDAVMYAPPPEVNQPPVFTAQPAISSVRSDGGIVAYATSDAEGNHYNVDVKIDGGSWNSAAVDEIPGAAKTVIISGLSPGSYSIQLRITAVAGDTTPVLSETVNLTVPAANTPSIFVQHPFVVAVSDAQVTLFYGTFDADGDQHLTEYRVDGSPWRPARTETPSVEKFLTITGLAAGDHTIELRITAVTGEATPAISSPVTVTIPEAEYHEANVIMPARGEKVVRSTERRIAKPEEFRVVKAA